ncbi:MAG: hypothetical protein PHZ09_01710 [Eubacteriales bacterium]|jgi:hypothetical protein|nr:hypothetical protein [Eubacteriales bacterium]
MKTVFAIVIIAVSVLWLCPSCAGEEITELTEGTGDISQIGSKDIGESFIYIQDGRETGLDYETFPLQWNLIYFSFVHYSDLFYDRYAAGGQQPQKVPDGAEIVLGFGDNTPASLTITRDPATYTDEEGGPAEEVHYTVNIASEQTAVFDVDFRESEVLYYTVLARWSNGNTVLYAFAVGLSPR